MSGLSKLPTKGYQKTDFSNQKSTAQGFKFIKFAHKATGGETFLNLNALSQPSEMTGFTNPSGTDIVAAKLLFYKNNLILTRSSGSTQIAYASYQVVSSSQINLTTPALPNEIFEGTIIMAPTNGMVGLDARVIHVSGVLTAGQTDINVGQDFKANNYPSAQVGEVLLILDGQPQARNAGNVTAAPTADGNYQEVDSGTGYATILRMNSSVTYDRPYMVLSTVAIVQRPDGSRDAALETMSGQVDQIINVLAQVSGQPTSYFRTAPSSVQLQQFGNTVINHETRIATLQSYRQAPQVTVLTSGTTYNTPANALYLKVKMLGGGGGGAGSGTSGAGNGGTGGDTTFGTLTASGGVGAGGGNANGGAGGGVTVGSGFTSLVAVPGNGGQASWPLSATLTNISGGQGGAGAFGGVGRGANNNNASAAPAANSGCGGPGGSANSLTTGYNGAGGGAGGFIEAIATAPLSTYAFSVGAAGSAGTLGTGGIAGAAGAAGIIIVEAFFN